MAQYVINREKFPIILENSILHKKSPSNNNSDKSFINCKNINISFLQKIIDCSGQYIIINYDNFFDICSPFLNSKINQKIFYNDNLEDIKCVSTFIFNFKDKFFNYEYKNKKIFYLNILDFDTHNKAIIAKPGFSSDYDTRFIKFKSKSCCNSHPILFFDIACIENEEDFHDYIKKIKPHLFSPFLINRMSLIEAIQKLDNSYKNIDISGNEVFNTIKKGKKNIRSKIFDISGNKLYDTNSNLVKCNFDFFQSKETYYFSFELINEIFNYRNYLQAQELKDFHNTMALKNKDIELKNKDIEILKLQIELEKLKQNK